jgi:hypothetical protein
MNSFAGLLLSLATYTSLYTLFYIEEFALSSPQNPSSQNRGYLTHRIFPPMFGGLGAGFFGGKNFARKTFFTLIIISI